jgi:hypothetical protein
MRLAGIIVLTFTALVPLVAGAVDVNLGIKTEAGYDSNVNRSKNAEGDFSFRFSPDIELAVQDAKFGASLRYIPTYEAFVTLTDASDLTHDLRNRFSWAASDKTKLSLRNRFRVLDVLNFGDDEFVGEGDPPVPDDDIRRDRILTLGSSFNLSHAFSPRWSGSTDVAFTLFETERRNASDSMSVSAFQSFNYAVDAANRVGIAAGGVLQRYDGVDIRPANDSYVFRVYGSYVRNFGERTTLSIRVGPAVISNDQDSFDQTISGVPTYDFVAVDAPTRMGALRDIYGDDVDAASQHLEDGALVPAGSVIVPDAQSCIGLAPAQAALLEGSGCERRTVLRPFSQDAGANNNAVIGLIRTQTREVVLDGSNSGSEDTKVTVFGDVTLSHIWTPNLVSTAAYNRRQSTAASQGVGTIADSLSFRTTWSPTPLWNLSVRANYIKRQSPNNLSRTYYEVEPTNPLGSSFTLVTRNGAGQIVEVSNSVDTQRWGVGLRAARRITRRMTASARADWSRQESNNSSRNPNNFGVFTIFMGIKYDLDRLRF